MNKHTVYLEEGIDVPLMEHVVAAWQGFKWDNYTIKLVEPTYFDQFLHDRKERFEADKGAWFYRHYNPVVGSIEFTQSALRYFGAAVPKPLNIPLELLKYAGRAYTRTTIGEIIQLNKSWGGEFKEHLFVKPADAHKLFTGDVLHNSAQFDILYDSKLSREQWHELPILVSPVIPIRSEYRVFVNRDRKIMDMRCYAGDPFVAPSKSRVLEMITAYQSAPSAYALDVYVTPGNQTFVMECNDFWALGTYGMDPITYSRLLAQRWHQLLS